MKKTILAAATLSVLMASGMANAAFTESDAAGNWTGNLEFNGTISNSNPVWTYQIPDAAVAGVKNWDADRASGTVDGDNTNYIWTKNITVLEGVMKAPRPAGGPGFQPIVTFGDEAKVVFDSTVEGPQYQDLTLKAKNGDTAVGNLSMALEFQAASQGEMPEKAAVVREDSYKKVPDALALLKAQPYYAPTYGGKHGLLHTNVQSTRWMQDPALRDLSAALVAKASSFKASFPTSAIPDTWTATLPITITVK